MLWDESASECCYCWKRACGLTDFSQSTFVLSGLPLVSFSSLIMSELSWEKEERKTRKKNPAGNQQTNQKKFHKPWSGVGCVINIRANMKNWEDSEGDGGKQVEEERVREGREGWSSAVLCLQQLIQTDWIAFSCRVCHSGPSVGF